MTQTETEPTTEAEAVEERRYAVAVDCDGVLHSYVSGWQGAENLPDPPVEGAIEWLNEVSEHYDVVVFTTRAREPGGADAVYEYLREHGYEGDLVVTAEKLPALVYVDDRGYRFRGKFPTVRQIRYALRPWRVDTEEVRKPPLIERFHKRGAEQQKLQEKHRRVRFDLREAKERLERVAVLARVVREEVDEEDQDFAALTALLDEAIGEEPPGADEAASS